MFNQPRDQQFSETDAVPRVTIGMPVFNGARFLREALDSLLAQTFDDFELIVSDNASTDETSSIIRHYAERDSRVRSIRHEANRGAAWNFNFVFAEARAPYFKWAAADDVCAPTFLEKCVAALDDDPTLVCCHARTRKIDEAGQILEHLDDPTDGGLPSAWFVGTTPRHHRLDASSPHAPRRFGDVLLSSGWAVRCAGVMRSDALRQTSLIKPIYGYEKVTMGELALSGRFYDLPEALFFQRVHNEASSQLVSATAQQEFFGGRRGPRRGQRTALLLGHLRAVWQAPLSLTQRLQCGTWIVSYLLQLHKWPGIIRSVTGGRGLGHRAGSQPPMQPSDGPSRHGSEACRSMEMAAEPLRQVPVATAEYSPK